VAQIHGTNLPSSASLALQVDLGSGQEVQRIPGIGDKAHGAVLWSSFLLTLDSDGGALAQVDTSKGSVQKLWQVRRQGCQRAKASCGVVRLSVST
jgi:hypothetical protein